jgi:hypothetical protein
VRLGRGPLSLVSTIEELLGIRRADYATPIYPQKLALTSSTRSGRSVGIVCSRTKTAQGNYVSSYSSTINDFSGNTNPVFVQNDVYRLDCLCPQQEKLLFKAPSIMLNCVQYFTYSRRMSPIFFIYSLLASSEHLLYQNRLHCIQ